MTTTTLDKVMSSVNGDHTDSDPTRVAYTFPSSGVTAIVRKVSQRRATDHYAKSRRDNPPPVAPKTNVDVAGEKVLREDPTSVEYQAWQMQLLSYETTFKEKEEEWFVGQTLVIDHEAVTTYRAKSLVEDDTDYGEHPDWYIFLWHICALDPRDWYNNAQNIALFLSFPTPASIADAQSRFRGKV
jgi:hypothetical protein